MFKIKHGQIFNERLQKFTQIDAKKVGCDKYDFTHRNGVVLAQNVTLERFVASFWVEPPKRAYSNSQRYRYQ